MTSMFRPATTLLVQYAQYHRDRRNIATHFAGIPLIVFAIGVLLARPSWALGGLVLTPAWVVWALSTLWYVSRGQLFLGLAVSVVNGLLIALAQQVSGGSVTQWLGWGLGCFVFGWALQFLGHYYEGRKPAFVDDLIGLLVAPMFVTAEVLFALGWGEALHTEIERSAGPTVIRKLSRIEG